MNWREGERERLHAYSEDKNCSNSALMRSRPCRTRRRFRVWLPGVLTLLLATSRSSIFSKLICTFDASIRLCTYMHTNESEICISCVVIEEQMKRKEHKTFATYSISANLKASPRHPNNTETKEHASQKVSRRRRSFL